MKVSKAVWLWLGFDFASNDIFLDLLQIRFDCDRDKRIEFMKRCKADLTSLQCANMFSTAECAIHNSFHGSNHAYIIIFLDTCENRRQSFDGVTYVLVN